MRQQSLVGAAVVLIAVSLFLGTTRDKESHSAEPDLSEATERIGILGLAEDQIYNDGESTTSLSFSLVEGGFSLGTVDEGGNIDDDPLFVNPKGSDRIAGSFDDVIAVLNGSPAVDAGNESHLPADVFDLDGDGDTTEPFPTDVAGGERSFSGTRVDMGAHESTATGIGIDRRPEVPDQQFDFDLPYPNPIGDRGELGFKIPITEQVEVAVFDALGRMRLTLFDDVAEADRHYGLEISSSMLSNGVYFVRLSSASFERTEKFVVLR